MDQPYGTWIFRVCFKSAAGFRTVPAVARRNSLSARYAGDDPVPCRTRHRQYFSAMRTLPFASGNNSTDSRDKKWIHRITTIETYHLAISPWTQSVRHWNAHPKSLKIASSSGWNALIQRLSLFSVENLKNRALPCSLPNCS